MQVTIKSETYVHAVHFNLGEDILLSDEYFDLLPGESRIINLGNVQESFREDNINAKCIESRI